MIDWWPPAPGWWLLAMLLLVGALTALYMALQRWQRKAYRRQALRQLDALQAAGAQQTDASYATQLNALLKSTALAAYPARQVAAQHGEQWRAFLNRELPAQQQFEAAFFAAAYISERGSTDAARLDRNALYACARHWIKIHRVTPC